MQTQLILHFMPEDIAARLPKRLLEIRKAQNLTQVDVAKAVGTTQSTYALYESGARGISLKLLPKLAKALDVSLETLLGIQPQQAKGKPGPVSKLEQRFAKIHQLPKKEQELAIEMLDRIIEAAIDKL